jgi:hypothetical protein
MAAEIITTDDLREFKKELLSEIKKLLHEQGGQPTSKWIRSNEVKKMLGLSPGTLQNLRINGTLPFTKIGGVIFYNLTDIQKMLAENRIHHKFR